MPKPRGLPTLRVQRRGLPAYVQSMADRQRQQQIQDRRQQAQDRQANQARAAQQQNQPPIANNPYRTTTGATITPQAGGRFAVPDSFRTVNNLWNQFLAWARGTPYQGLTNQYGQPLVPDYVNPQGQMDAWGVNQPYQQQQAIQYVPSTGSTLNPPTMANWRNVGLRNNPSRHKMVNTSQYRLSAPSVPLDTGGDYGYGGYGNWGGGGGGGYTDNYVSQWYNSLVNWTFGDDTKK